MRGHGRGFLRRLLFSPNNGKRECQLGRSRRGMIEWGGRVTSLAGSIPSGYRLYANSREFARTIPRIEEEPTCLYTSQFRARGIKRCAILRGPDGSNLLRKRSKTP